MKRIVHVASVIGREFPLRILETLAGMQEELRDRLASLQELDLIFEGQRYPELEYRFKHALVQEVAYNSLLVKRKKEIHDRIGEAMERIYEDRLEEFYDLLAYHYSRGGHVEKAYRYLMLSGDKAARNHSNWEALRFYEQAVRVLGDRPETDEKRRKKLSAYLSMITSMFFLSYPEITLKTLEEAQRLSEELGDKRSLAGAYGRLGNDHALRGNLLLGMEYSEKCFTEAEKIEAVDLTAESAVILSTALWVSGDLVKLVDISRRGIQLLEKHRREKDVFLRGFNAYSLISGHCGSNLAALGEFERGREELEKGLENALEVKDDYTIAFVEINLCYLSYWEGDGRSVVDHAEKALRYCEERGFGIYLGLAWSVLTAGWALAGDCEKAKKHADKGPEAQKDVGVPVGLPLCYYFVSMAHAAS